jgi:hypothetical protein
MICIGYDLGCQCVACLSVDCLAPWGHIWHRHRVPLVTDDAGVIATPQAISMLRASVNMSVNRANGLADCLSREVKTVEQNRRMRKMRRLFVFPTQDASVRDPGMAEMDGLENIACRILHSTSHGDCSSGR